MSLVGPNRTFGKGERREQNAVIKVYSANELKVALTKVYQLPNNVGTIQIAGDITITEPIKLKVDPKSFERPKEIIIQSIGGARIYNGGAETGNYNYNIVGNTSIPVFDFGDIFGLGNIYVKFTFKDIIVNNITSEPFGSFIGIDLVGRSANTWFTPVIEITNLKVNNVWSLVSCYDSTNTFGGQSHIVMYGAKINGVSIKNDNTSITGFYLSNSHLGIEYGNFSNFGVLNDADQGIAPFASSNDLVIVTNGFINNNNIYSISTNIRIENGARSYTGYLADYPDGQGNTISGADITDTFPTKSFNYVNCRHLVNISALFVTENTQESLITSAIAKQTDISGNVLDTDFVVDTTFCKYTNGLGEQILALEGASSNLNDANYEVNWHLSIRERTTGLTNCYHIKTNCKGIAGIITVISNTTVSSSEEFFTLTGITPAVGSGGIEINPTAGAANLLDVACVIHIKGYKILSNYF